MDNTAQDKTHEDARVLYQLISDTGPSETGQVIDFLTASSKVACFAHFWKRLHTSRDTLDLGALRVCIKLLPEGDEHVALHTQLGERVVGAIPTESSHPERLYTLTELCLSNPVFGWKIFHAVFAYLSIVEHTIRQNPDEIAHDRSHWMTQSAVAYLDFLKCSYWRPSDHGHYVTPGLIWLLCDLAGIDGLDDATHDALSALLSLLRTSANLLPPLDKEGPSGYISNEDPVPRLIGQQLLNRYQQLPDAYFHSSGRAYRTWFQWACVATANNIELDGVYEATYWSRLRFGLLSGFSEQRRYCLGILRQSLQLPQKDIDMPLMTLDVARRSEYQQQYETYCSLFETIVLDRYLNQIQACLPELTRLFGHGTLISFGWITTLLSAALSPKIQDGVRKAVGTWYIKLVTEESHIFDDGAEEQRFFDENSTFLVEGFLPWATQGSLFSSSLTSTRHSTDCSHGDVLSEVISRFISKSSGPTRRELLNQIIRFILDRGGRIFQHSIIYLLRGLLDGFKGQSEPVLLEAKDFVLLPSISRLPGLPEVASDLCTTYCADFCNTFYFSTERSLSAKPEDIPGYGKLNSRFEELQNQSVLGPAMPTDQQISPQSVTGDTSALQQFFDEVHSSQHKRIQGSAFAPACDEVIKILDANRLDSLSYPTLRDILEALWDEAERQEFARPVAVKIPPLFFHPNCVHACVTQSRDDAESTDDQSLVALLTTVMEQLFQLAEGRVYLLSALIDSLRKACFTHPQIIRILPYEDFLLRFVEKPSAPKKEFLFEVAAAEKLEQYFKHRTYSSYYGQREWHAYASVIDILNRFPGEQMDVAMRLLERLVEPWRSQKKSHLILHKWKNTFQLQAMLVLSESCISADSAAWYLDSFMHALNIEQWPRYRFLLEWIISRIYYRFPHLADRILPDLAKLDDAVPVVIASQMKLAVLASSFLKSKEFALQLMTQLIPFAASQKVHIRHEAQWSFPIVWDLAEQNKWSVILENPAFKALNEHIRSLQKFKDPAWTIRTLKVDIVKDFTLVNIFQGEYLTIESPERELATYDDFINLWEGDCHTDLSNLPNRIPLGERKPESTTNVPCQDHEDIDAPTNPDTSPTPFQTKSGFDLASLLPAAGPPSATPKRPASVVLIASLIDNPTNLGGLSRISESFGLEALCINTLSHLSSREFQATAVTSHKHLPIQELKPEDIPSYLIEMKRNGYEVVAVEQTDRSGYLGDDSVNAKGGVGRLAKKCVLVLGSEKGGVTSEVLAVVDRCVEIKTVGVTRSLNVQTAGGIAVFEWWREWGGAGSVVGSGQDEVVSSLDRRLGSLELTDG